MPDQRRTSHRYPERHRVFEDLPWIFDEARQEKREAEDAGQED